jgi:tetratricopeptide (TPR) repeat protein
MYEIGGDICVADTIYLKEKQYSVFLNGDAMGKSIQGAGGAIVLGVVFKSIITRTKIHPQIREMFPEVWIKTAFLELQEVFESFNGSMLVSIVMGLVEEETGLMYYINAEHPWTALYRDEIASFIEEDSMYKVGISFEFEPFKVKLFQLMDGDSVFIGSDGRDDIQINKEKTQKIINEDHLLFLDSIKKSKGNLNDLVEILKNIGLLTDDLSLLNIRYNYRSDSIKNIRITPVLIQDQIISNDLIQKLKDIHKESTDDTEVLTELVNIYSKLEDYQSAAHYSNKHLNLEPYNTNLLFKTVLFYYKSQQYKESAELGERLKIRDPQNLDYLVILADSYIQLKNLERAESLIRSAMSISPDNTGVMEILEELKKRKTLT